ncbi:MAG: ATP-binding protein, partial [Candidatus Limnocylindria bacterium]
MTSRIPPSIHAAVRSFAREHGLLRPGPLVVAISGGADSTALLFILADLADELGLVLHAAHFDHRMRARAGAADAAFASECAARVGA